MRKKFQQNLVYTEVVHRSQGFYDDSSDALITKKRVRRCIKNCPNLRHAIYGQPLNN